MSYGLRLTQEQLLTYQNEFNHLNQKYINLALENKKNNMKNTNHIFDMHILIVDWDPPFFNDIKTDIK